MTPKFIGRRAAYARRLVANRLLKPNDWLILDSILFNQGRALLADRVICSYDDIMAKVHIGRASIAAALKRLAMLGLLYRRQRWELVPWTRGRRWVQLANEYRISPDGHCEFWSATRSKEKSLRKKEAAREQEAVATPSVTPTPDFGSGLSGVLADALANLQARMKGA